MTTTKLYTITRHYDKKVAPIGLAYGNGFDRQGSKYFSYLLEQNTQFKNWVKANHPDLIS